MARSRRSDCARSHLARRGDRFGQGHVSLLGHLVAQVCRVTPDTEPDRTALLTQLAEVARVGIVAGAGLVRTLAGHVWKSALFVHCVSVLGRELRAGSTAVS